METKQRNVEPSSLADLWQSCDQNYHDKTQLA